MMMKNIIAASILAVGLVVYGLVSRRPTSYGVAMEKTEYRYQFFDDELYFKQKVFDRKTGVAYYVSKNDEGKCYAIDYKNGALYCKEINRIVWKPNKTVNTRFPE